jgi:hypothetical protein
MTRLAVPYPPETVEQARAWVVWAETAIGVGFHPDSSGREYLAWGTRRRDGVPLLTGKTLARFDEGLTAAHRLLPDIYETSMDIFKELHPEVFE